MIEHNRKNLENSCEWPFPVPIIYGPGRLKELGRRTAEMALLYPLIVTDRGLPNCLSANCSNPRRGGSEYGVFRDLTTRLVRTLNGRANAIARAGMTA